MRAKLVGLDTLELTVNTDGITGNTLEGTCKRDHASALLDDASIQTFLNTSAQKMPANVLIAIRPFLRDA